MKLPRLNLAHPLIIYTAAWLLVLFLVGLQLTVNLPPINDSTLILVLSNIISFWLIYLFLLPAYPRGRSKSTRDISPQVMLRLKRFVKGLLVFWTVSIAFEVIYAGGVPLMWALSGNIEKSYVDFGIPTFHGLLNSIYFFSITALFLDFVVSKRRQSLFLVMMLLMWPVVAFARSVLMGALCQMAGVYLLLHRVSLSTLLKLLLVVLVIIWAFGWIGDLRGTPDPFANLVDSRYQETISQLPTGFLWFYVYLTSPLGNIISNIDVVQPTYFPYYSIANLVPTALRGVIMPEIVRPDDLELVVANLNVSTFYAGFLSDYGVIGSIVSVAVLQVFIVIVYFYAKRKKVWAILAYAVLFQSIVFSVFYNLLSSQVYLIQIVIALYFGSRVKRLSAAHSVQPSPTIEMAET